MLLKSIKPEPVDAEADIDIPSFDKLMRVNPMYDHFARQRRKIPTVLQIGDAQLVIDGDKTTDEMIAERAAEYDEEFKEEQRRWQMVAAGLLPEPGSEEHKRTLRAMADRWRAEREERERIAKEKIAGN